MILGELLCVMHGSSSFLFRGDAWYSRSLWAQFLSHAGDESLNKKQEFIEKIRIYVCVMGRVVL